MWDKNKIIITAIKDPFDPYKSRLIKQVEHNNSSAFDYMKELYPFISDDIEIVSSVNGKLLDDTSYVPIPGDNLVFALVPAGDDVGRFIAGIALIAIAIYAPYAVGPYYAGLGAGTYGGAMLSAGIMIAGSMVINSVFPQHLDPQAFGDPGDKSSTYGWAAGANPIEPGNPWGVLYGTTRIFPQLLGRYLDTVDNKQYLNMLFGLTDHLLDSVTLTEFNENAESQYTDIKIDKRLGENDQPAISYFNDSYTEQSVSQKLEYGSWRTITAPGNTTAGLVAALLFPSGLSCMSDAGELTATDVSVDIQYRTLATPHVIEWTSLKAPESPDAWSSGYGTYTLEDIITHNTIDYRCISEHESSNPNAEPGVGEYQDSYWQTLTLLYDPISGASRSALRKAYRIDHIPADEYEMRACLTVDPDTDVRYSNEVWFDYVQSIIYDDFAYPGACVMGIRALATDQLSGGMPRTSFLAIRTNVSVWTGGGWENKPSNNPAWAAYDMHVNEEYGAAIPYDRMNYQEFSDWADFCTSYGYTVNIYFDSFKSFPQAVNVVSIMGRATVVQRGTQFGVVIDKADTPVQMFGMGNIVANSYKETFLDKKDRANCIEVTYFDAALNYIRQTIELRSSDFDTDTDITENKIQLILYGCTSKNLAIAHAKFLLNCNEYLMRTIVFDVGVDALASEVGDIILVSHDVPQWGYSGHVVTATSSTVTLDRMVTLESGTSYQVIVRHSDDDDLETVNLAFTAPDWTSTTDYLLDEGVEYAGDKYTAKLAHTSGVSFVSADWTLDNTEINIKKLTLGATWTQNPQAQDVISFGEVNIVAKEFKIVSITRAQELTRTITALEYRSEVYDDSASIPEYEADSALELSVDDINIQEVWQLENGTGIALINLSWRGIGIHTVFIREDTGKPWNILDVGAYGGRNDYNVKGLEPGKTYYFAISPSTNPDDGESTSLAFVGYPPTPEDPTGLSASVEDVGFTIKWTKRDFPWITGYDIAIDTADNPDDDDIISRNYAGIEYLFAQFLTIDTYYFSVRTVDAFSQTSAWVSSSIVIAAYSAPLNLTESIEENHIRLDWDIALDGSLPINEYEIRKGAVFSSADILGRTKATFMVVTEQSIAAHKFWVVTIDVGGFYGIETYVDKTLAIYDAPITFTAIIVENQVKLNWSAALNGSFTIRHYEIRRGTTWGAAAFEGTTNATHFFIDEQSVATHKFWIAAVDAVGNYGTETSVDKEITAYNAPGNPNYTIEEDSIRLSWNAPTGGGLALAEYRVLKGAVYGSAVLIDYTTATYMIVSEQTAGTYTYWVEAIDVAGNVGSYASIGVTLTAYSAPGSFTVSVIDNNVLLQWTQATGGSFSLDEYEVRKGDVFSTADVIGRKKGTFTTTFEAIAGTYKYWIVAYDVGGNLGAELSLTTTVSQPPDFVLNTQWEADFSWTATGTPVNVMVLSDGTAIAPYNVGRTWAEHFTYMGTAPVFNQLQDFVNAGYTYMPEPVPLTASYLEEFDYGTVLGSSLITVDLDKVDYNDGVTVVTKIATKKLVGDSYDEKTAPQIFETDFQYIRDKFEITSATDKDFTIMDQHIVRLDTKLVSDAGKGVVGSPASSGEQIIFSANYVDVVSITVTPWDTSPSSPIIPVVDFVDAPNPTDFMVYLFDKDGNFLEGTFSWSSRGYQKVD